VAVKEVSESGLTSSADNVAVTYLLGKMPSSDWVIPGMIGAFLSSFSCRAWRHGGWKCSTSRWLIVAPPGAIQRITVQAYFQGSTVAFIIERIFRR